MTSQPSKARNVVAGEHFIRKTNKIFTLKAKSIIYLQITEFLNFSYLHNTSLLLWVPLFFTNSFASVFTTQKTTSASTISTKVSPGWCGSVDWELTCKPKGHQFNSRSGYVPGLQARLSRGISYASSFLSLSGSLAHKGFSPSLPVSLKINEENVLNNHKSHILTCI